MPPRRNASGQFVRGGGGGRRRARTRGQALRRSRAKPKRSIFRTAGILLGVVGGVKKFNDNMGITGQDFGRSLVMTGTGLDYNSVSLQSAWTDWKANALPRLGPSYGVAFTGEVAHQVVGNPRGAFNTGWGFKYNAKGGAFGKWNW